MPSATRSDSYRCVVVSARASILTGSVGFYRLLRMPSVMARPVLRLSAAHSLMAEASLQTRYLLRFSGDHITLLKPRNDGKHPGIRIFLSMPGAFVIRGLFHTYCSKKLQPSLAQIPSKLQAGAGRYRFFVNGGDSAVVYGDFPVDDGIIHRRAQAYCADEGGGIRAGSDQFHAV